MKTIKESPGEEFERDVLGGLDMIDKVYFPIEDQLTKRNFGTLKSSTDMLNHINQVAKSVGIDNFNMEHPDEYHAVVQRIKEFLKKQKSSMTENKKIIKEAPTQSIPTPRSVLNYEDNDVVAGIKKEIGKNKDFTILKIYSNADQYYNVVVSYMIPEEEWSFELDKYKYLQQLHQYRVELFTALSKILPVVNINLAAWDFVKGNEEIKFAFTILLSNTNNKDWVTGRVKKTDAKERLKLLQTEAKGGGEKKKIDEVGKILDEKSESIKYILSRLKEHFKEKDLGEVLKTIIHLYHLRTDIKVDNWTKLAQIIYEWEEEYVKSFFKEKENVMDSLIEHIREENEYFDNEDQKIQGYDNLDEDIATGFEYQPANVPGTPTSDEDFLECDGMTKSIPVKESELVEGKLYQLSEVNGLIKETVQLIQENNRKYLFEKTATGAKIRINGKDISNHIFSIKKKVKESVLRFNDGVNIDTSGDLAFRRIAGELYVTGKGWCIPVKSRDEAMEIIRDMVKNDPPTDQKISESKQIIKEGWKLAVAIKVPDAIDMLEKARGLRGVVGVNAITKDEIKIQYDSRKTNPDTLKAQLNPQKE